MGEAKQNPGSLDSIQVKNWGVKDGARIGFWMAPLKPLSGFCDLRPD
jgi:hypothetical protein